jgi:hypothetical protein
VKTSIRASLRHQRDSEDHPLKWAFDEASTMGFDGLEICMNAGGTRPTMAGVWPDEQIQGTKDLCKQHGMSIFSLSADWAWGFSGFFPTLRGWQGRGVELMEEDAKLANDLGAEAILIHFGTSTGSWEECRALLEPIAKAGEKHKVKMAYEASIWGRLGLGEMETLTKMVDEVGSEWFGVYLHNWYPRRGGTMEQEIVEAGSQRLVNPFHFGTVDPVSAEIDWPKASAAVKEHLPGMIATFEISWDVAAANKKRLDEIAKEYF